MSNVFGKALQSIKNEHYGTSTLKDPKPWLIDAIGGHTTSGIVSNEKTALTLSAYYDGVNLIANHCAYLPFHVITRDYDTGNINQITDHSLRELLQFETNMNMSAFTFKKLMTVWMLNWGNAYALIERRGNTVTSLKPKKPWETDVRHNKETGEVFYEFKNDNKIHPARDVLHLHQFSTDGISGKSIIEAGARDRIAGHIATERYGERFYKNGTHMGGVLISEDSLGSDPGVVNKTKSQIRQELDNVYKGDNNWHKIGILEGKYEYKNLTLKASDAQLIERSKASVEDIARWLGVPVSKLKGDQNTSYNTREFESLDYVQDGLTPRVHIWQQETRRKLLTEREKRQGYETQISTKDLLRGDLKSLAEFLGKMVDRAVFTPNQALRFLGEDTFEGGDVHLMQRNMETLENYQERVERGEDDQRVINNFVSKMKRELEDRKE